MMRWIIIPIMMAMSGCISSMKVPKNPCLADEFLEDIDRYSRGELTKLVNILESSSTGTSNACKTALLAKIYFSLSRMSLASDYFSKAALQLPELGHYFLLAKAQAELKQHNFNQAFSIANTLLESSPAPTPQFALRIKKVLADIAVAEKDNQHIIKTHQALLGNGLSEHEALLFNLATALSNAGEHEKANDVYKRLLIRFPTSAGAKKAEKLKNLAHYNLDLKDLEKRFDKLIEKLAFDRVVADVDMLAKQSAEPAQSQLAFMAVKSLMANNQFAKALTRSSKRALAKNPTPKDLESYAYSLAKAGHLMDAADFYGRLHNSSTDKEERARGCFFRGFSFYEASLYSMALFAWQGCKDSVESTSLHENYLWYTSLAFMLQNHHRKSIDILDEALNKFPKSSDSEKYTYFIGLNLHNINKITESTAQFARLAASSQSSYYGQLARQMLKKTNPKGLAVATDALAKLAKNVHHKDGKNALLMFHLGFKDEAREIITGSSLPANDKLALLQHMGFYHDAFKRAGTNAGAVKIENDQLLASVAIRAQFPLPHKRVLDEVSKKYGINPNLVYAIMKTESSFSENAVSPRGAMGLMQMMPFVAQDLGARLSIDRITDEHLNNPKVAIELGTLLLATLKRQFNDHHLVVAAYNAGGHQVQKWLNLFGHLPTEVFIERIPFKQTRDYVKKVLHTESLYHALNGQELRLYF